MVILEDHSGGRAEMTTADNARSGHAFAVTLASILIVMGCLGTAAEARGGRGGGSRPRATRSGTSFHHSRGHGSFQRSSTRYFGYRSRGLGDERFGALGRRFRRGPDGVLYAMDGDVNAEVVRPLLRPACVYDRVPEPPAGYTVFSRPPRPFEVTGQPVAFSEDVPVGHGSFRLCE